VYAKDERQGKTRASWLVLMGLAFARIAQQGNLKCTDNKTEYKE
jgi:hypothetical protein